MRYAHVVDGVVQNIVNWDPVKSPDFRPDQGEFILIEDRPEAVMGALYDKDLQAFAQPPPPPAVPLELVARGARKMLALLFAGAQGDYHITLDKREELRLHALETERLIGEASDEADIRALLASYRMATLEAIGVSTNEDQSGGAQPDQGV